MTFGSIEGLDLTLSGMTVDQVGNVDISGNLDVTGSIAGASLSVSGTTIDASGNLEVVGYSTSVEALNVNQSIDVQQSVHVNGGGTVDGGLFLGGGLYVQKNVVVGDALYGDGVTLDCSGTVLNIHGVTQDSSGEEFPISVDILGNLMVHGSIFTDKTTIDSSGNIETDGSIDGNRLTVLHKITGKSLELADGQATVDASGNIDTSGNIDADGSVSALSFIKPGQFSLGTSIIDGSSYIKITPTIQNQSQPLSNADLETNYRLPIIIGNDLYYILLRKD